MCKIPPETGNEEYLKSFFVEELGELVSALETDAKAKNEVITEEVTDVNQRLEMWATLRKEDALATVTQGNASLYFTPADCNLSIEKHHTA